MSNLILKIDGKRYVTAKNTAIIWSIAGAAAIVIGMKLASK